MSVILVTGATGFIGQALVNQLCMQPEHRVVAVVRDRSDALPRDVKLKFVEDITQQPDWSSALEGVDVVVHLAARAHVAQDNSADSLSSFRRINVDATSNLAQQAAKAGVKRFIFMSSIGVNGNLSREPFIEEDVPEPVEYYALSKYEAEQALRQISNDSGMEIVILRPPLVYGPNAHGNFGKLVRAIEKGIPLPLGATNNKRSLVALDNLVDFIITCVDHPKAGNEVFLVSDGEDLSTTELIKSIARAVGKSPRLIPVPVGLMRFAARFLGRQAVADRLFGSLQVDSTKARELLGWQPVVTMDEQLRKMVGK